MTYAGCQISRAVNRAQEYLEAIYRETRNVPGYVAMQGGDPELCGRFGLELIGDGVIATLAEAEKFVASWKEKGAICATCIVGYGYESDAEMDALVWEILEVSQSYKFPHLCGSPSGIYYAGRVAGCATANVAVQIATECFREAVCLAE